MDPAAEALRRHIEEVVDSRLDAWQKATAIATPPQPEPAPPGWIIDRVPTAEDGDFEDEVKVPARFGVGYTLTDWKHVHPGTPWSRTGSEPGPWDPHTFDRNGWISSRLPTATDTGYAGQVLIPAGDGYDTATIHHLLIVPGQPWAPWASGPSSYQP